MGFPNSPTNGQEATVNGVRYAYNSTLTAWVRVPVVNWVASTSPPGNPVLGDHWYDTTDDVLYEWTFDGTNYYWIDITSGLVSGTTTTVLPFHPFLTAGM